jgi:hypothetical protein
MWRSARTDVTTVWSQHFDSHSPLFYIKAHDGPLPSRFPVQSVCHCNFSLSDEALLSVCGRQLPVFLLYKLPECDRLLYLVSSRSPVGRISFYFLEGESVFSESLSFGEVPFPSPCLSELPGITLRASPLVTLQSMKHFLRGRRIAGSQPFKKELSKIEHVKLGS